MSGLAKRKYFERFTTTGSTLTWTKPSGVSVVWIECYGAGGGGGGGGSQSSHGTAATANTGSGGGGGGGHHYASGAGGSGLVIIRYQFQ